MLRVWFTVHAVRHASCSVIFRKRDTFTRRQCCLRPSVEGVFTAMNSSRSLAGPVHGPHCVCSSHLPCVCGQALWPEQLCAQLSLFLACSTSLFFCIVSSAIITDLLSSCFLLLFLLLALSRGLVCCHMLLLHHAHPHPWLGRRSALGLKAPSLELGCLGLNSAFESYHYRLLRFMTLDRLLNLPEAQFPCV